jgi:hypothetical protein
MIECGVAGADGTRCGGAGENSPIAVSRELGHGSEEMVQRVYSHLGQVRHLAEVVEYRIERTSSGSASSSGGSGLTQRTSQRRGRGVRMRNPPTT